MDDERAATVTVDVLDGPLDAARIANEETSALAAAIVTEDPAAATAFLDAYAGASAFWNATTHLLDGFRLLRLPETGINIDRVPGPRPGELPRPDPAAVRGAARRPTRRRPRH